MREIRLSDVAKFSDVRIVCVETVLLVFFGIRNALAVAGGSSKCNGSESGVFGKESKEERGDRTG